jgi:hypothetical protein
MVKKDEEKNKTAKNSFEQFTFTPLMFFLNYYPAESNY